MTPLVYTKTNKGELIMPIYNLHNFKFEEIQKDKEFSCMKYLDHDTIKTIVENVPEYFSVFVSEELQRSAEDLIKNGYRTSHFIVFSCDQRDKLSAYGTHIVISRRYETQVEIYIKDTNILVLKITVIDNKISYSDIVGFKIPTIEKILAQYQDREVVACTSRENIMEFFYNFACFTNKN